MSRSCLTICTQNTNKFVEFLRTDVFSGNCEYDVFGCYGLTTAACSIAGLCMDLKEYDYINFDKPWWPENLTEQATINRKLYFASGDISTSYLYEMYINFYNLDMVKEYVKEIPAEEILAEEIYTLMANTFKVKLDEIHRVVDTLKSVLMSRMQEAKLTTVDGFVGE